MVIFFQLFFTIFFFNFCLIFRYAKLRSDVIEPIPIKNQEEEEKERKKVWAKSIMNLIYKRLKDLEDNRQRNGLAPFEDSLSHRPPLLMMG